MIRITNSVFILILWMVTSCSNDKANHVADIQNDRKKAVEERNIRMTANIQGQQSKYLDVVSDNEVNLFAYFTASDCQPCLTKLDSLVRIVESNVGMEVIPILKGDYYKRSILNSFEGIRHDSLYMVENQIGFLSTPVLFAYRKGFGISEILIVTPYSQCTQIESFLEDVSEYPVETINNQSEKD